MLFIDVCGREHPFIAGQPAQCEGRLEIDILLKSLDKNLERFFSHILCMNKTVQLNILQLCIWWFLQENSFTLMHDMERKNKYGISLYRINQLLFTMEMLLFF